MTFLFRPCRSMACTMPASGVLPCVLMLAQGMDSS
jgi:hypothetical protein